VSDTTTCPSCSATLPAGAAFCTTCGTKIEAPAAAAPAPPAPSVDDTRVDNPGLADATQVYSPPPPEPVAAPPAPAPWQPADTGTPPAAPAWEQPAAPEPPAWSPPPAAAPPPAWEQPAAPAAAPPQWGAPGAPGQLGQPAGLGGAGAPGAPGAPPVGGVPPTWNQPASPPAWGAVPAAAPAPSSSSSGAGSPIGGILALLGGVLALVGLFSAWIGTNITDTTVTGWKLAAKDSGFKTNDPYILLALGIVAIVLGVLLFTGTARTPVRVVAIIIGLAIIGTHVRDWMDIADIAKALPSSVKITAKYGFYLGFIGAGLLIVGALMPGKKSAA